MDRDSCLLLFYVPKKRVARIFDISIVCTTGWGEGGGREGWRAEEELRSADV